MLAQLVALHDAHFIIETLEAEMLRFSSAMSRAGGPEEGGAAEDTFLRTAIFCA